MDNEKIFIQIASYRDPQLLPTLRNCVAMSKYPENLVFSIAWQHSVEDEWDNLYEYKDDSRFKIIDIDYRDSKGACWARNALQQQYDGEKYTLQIDSHHRFIKNWDEELITMYNQLKLKGIKKPLLTGYVSSFDPDNEPEGRNMTPWKMNFDRFIPEGAVFFLPASIDNHKELTEPIPARFYSAHFAFTSGNFVLEVPHDPEYYFHGEEISIAVRSYTSGYDLFHPHKVIIWHEYTRKGRTKQWDDDSEWSKKNSQSHLRNRKLFEMDGEIKDIDFGRYGFGDVRTLEDYERYAGISFKKRAVQKYTLDNNIAPNPPLYGQEFENSFLKIFKHCIDIHKGHFVDNDYDFWAVIFEMEDGTPVNRKDLTSDEIKSALRTNGEFVNIWRTFDVESIPYKWIVWPYSESKGWLDKIEGKLNKDG
jgi:glycosyltransferase involved in cell wall biosynthesis